MVPNGAVRRGGVHLQGDELLHTVPQGHHALDAGFGGGAEVGPHHEAVFPVIHLPVHHGIGVVFYIRVGGNGGADGLARAQLRRLGFQVASLKALYGLMKLAGQVCAFQRQAGGFLAAAIHAVIPCHAAQDHFWMLCKVAVDGDAVPGLPQVDPIRLKGDGSVPLLQKKNVGGDFRVGVSGKGVVGQTDSADQLGTLGDKAAYIGALLVHGSLGGHKGDDAAGPYLVDGFGEEVVVNVETKMIVGFVVDLVIPEGYVAHGQVEEVAPVGGFKPRHGDARFRIELPGDAACEAVQLHAVQAAARHALRQQAEEVAHAHSRLQNVAGAKAHLFHSVIDGANHRGAGVVGVEGGGAGRHVLRLGQQRLELRVLPAPVLVLRVKRLRDAAPTHIAGEGLLLLWRCLPGGFLQVFQQLDCRDIGLELGLGAAFAQVIVGDTEILGVAAQVLLVFPIGSFFGSPGIGESLPLAIDLNGYRVFVQHFIQGLFRFDGRCWQLRLIGPQGLNHHIIGQMVLVARIDSHGLGVESRGFSSRFRAFLSKTVQLTGVQPAQQRRNLVPAKEQHSQPLFVCIQHFQLNTIRSSPVVSGIAGLQLHRFHNVGIGTAQP